MLRLSNKPMKKSVIAGRQKTKPNQSKKGQVSNHRNSKNSVFFANDMDNYSRLSSQPEYSSPDYSTVKLNKRSSSNKPFIGNDLTELIDDAKVKALKAKIELERGNSVEGFQPQNLTFSRTLSPRKL